MKKIKQAVAVILCVTMLSSVLMLAPITACAAETSQKESTAFESNVSFHAEEAPEADPEETETTESQPETALPTKECIGEAVGAEASEPAQENGFTFVTAEGCAVITTYERDVSVTRLVIPNQLGGCPVTTIGQSVFSGADHLQEIVIPDSVTEIGGGSFEGCTELNRIQLPSKLEKLGPLAFKGCTGLTEIFLPKTLTTFEIDWHYTSPFVACDHLKKVVFEAGTTAVQNYSCKDLTSLEEVVIPDSVTVIGANAFTNCVSLAQSDLIPDSVTEIGGSSFEGCTGLNRIQLPSGLEKIGSLAFNGCTGLTEILLPKTLTTFEIDWHYTSPFVACDHLKKVVFEAGTTAVQNYSCKDLTSLEEVVIPDSVTVIGANAFTNCVSLTQSDLIPDGVTEIGGSSFEGCTGLNSIQLPSGLEKIGTLAFKGWKR